MSRIGLINPSSKRKNYQGLAKLSAVMPPHWLAVRANYHKAHNKEVIVTDCAVDELNPNDFADCQAIEVMPSGVHPHAFIHEQEGIERIIKELEPLDKPIEIITQLTFDPLKYPPDWTEFDLNKYHAHNWQTWGRISRNPYGTLATSVSCPNSCKFCNIDNYYNSGYKKQTMERIESDLRDLYTLGVRNIKMMDELFVTTEKRMYDFCTMIEENKFDNLNIWGYARFDGLLRLYGLNGWRRTFSKMKKAGINWICIGIESGNREIRKKYGKGDASNDEIIKLVCYLKHIGIRVLGNFMFGFPEDNLETMEETYDLAKDINCEYSNFYCMVPYPNTGMETYAKEQGWKFPETYSGYSQYSYDFQPLPTHYLSAKEVLDFRDESWGLYHTNRHYLSMIDVKFGTEVRSEIEEMTKIKLKRKILEED